MSTLNHNGKHIEDSLHANGKSYDIVGSEDEGRKQFRDIHFNDKNHVYVRQTDRITIDDNDYMLYEAYTDPGSEDYYYFSIKCIKQV